MSTKVTGHYLFFYYYFDNFLFPFRATQTLKKEGLRPSKRLCAKRAGPKKYEYVPRFFFLFSFSLKLFSIMFIITYRSAKKRVRHKSGELENDNPPCAVCLELFLSRPREVKNLPHLRNNTCSIAYWENYYSAY